MLHFCIELGLMFVWKVVVDIGISSLEDTRKSCSKVNVVECDVFAT